MNLINNRYRIVRSLTQNRLISSYLVSDAMNNPRILQLNIISSEFFSKSSIDFFIEEFKTLTNIDNANIVKVFNFGLIYSIDNKKLNNTEYFYTNQYIENNMNFYNLIKEINENSLLDVFLQVCKAINYLHLKGFLYGELNTKNIIINQTNKRYNIMIKDLPTLELEKQDYWSEKVGQFNYKAPELKAHNNPTISSDIYSLGVYLLALCKVDFSESTDISKKISLIKDEVQEECSSKYNSRCFYKDLMKIAEKMTQQHAECRYNNVAEIVKDINFYFNKKYEFTNKTELEKLNFNTKIVGRNVEIHKILSIYENLKNCQTVQNIILVHGEEGIGKTRLLKEINHILSMRKASIFSSSTCDNTTLNSNTAFANIIKKLVIKCDDEIIERYQSELIKFIPELGEKNNIETSINLSGEKEKYRLITRLSSFIREVTKDIPTVCIIDNVDYLDEFSVDFFEYFNAERSNDINIIFILSYSDRQYISNQKFNKFVNKRSNYMDIHLESLSTEQTASMIKGILSMPILPIQFGTIVYSKTYGNPLFIEETLKDSFAKKILYIDEIRGRWTVLFDTYEEMQMASTMEQALLNQIKEIDEENYKILSIISIFNSVISLEVIGKFFPFNKISLENHINELSAKGILYKKSQDRGFVIQFYNKALKNMIYNKINEEERKKNHEIAVFTLESFLAIEGKENKEEIIYHLEKSGDKNKLGKYLIENAKKMEKLKIMDVAVSNYEKAFELFSDSLNLNVKVEILFKIGDISEEMGSLSRALENYNRAYQYTIDLNQSLQVDALNKIAKIYFKKNQLEKAFKYLRNSELILDKIEYTEGYLQNKRILVRIYLTKQEYEKVYEICTKCIKCCGNKYIKHKGYFHINIGYMYMQTSRITEALENYNQAIKYHQDINFTEGVVTTLNNIGVIYGDYYQDVETAIQYFIKIEEISEKNNLHQASALALTNLAGSYLEKMDYNITLKYFKKALEKSKKLEFEYNIFYCYNYLSYVSLKMGSYSNAFEYFALAKKELEQYPNQDKENMAVYFQMGAELYYEIRDINMAYKFVTKSLDINNDDGSIQYKDNKVLFYFLEIYKADNLKSVEQIIELIKPLINSYLTDIRKINILYNLCILLYEKGYKEQAIIFLADNPQKKDFIIPDIVKANGLYLNGLIKKGNYSFKELSKALELTKKTKNKILQWRICTTLGDYYFTKNNCFYAANYYFEACEIIKDSILQLPEDIRTNCFETNDMIKPFNKINEMSKRFNDKKIAYIDKNEITISNSQDLNRLFNYDNFAEILSNKNFTKSAKKIYSPILPKGIHDINDVMMNMCEDSIVVLDTLTKLLSSMVLSTRSLIILDDHKGEYSVIATSNEMYELPEIKWILERTKEINSPVLMNDPHHDRSGMEFKFMPEGIKAIMCIPIVTKVNGLNIHERNVKGYLYMESERVLNNFNEKSLQKCMELISFISFVIESYQTKITSSIDKLTGTLTRKFLEDYLTEQVEKASSLKEVFSIVMLDLDNFKGVNDRFGHQTGDEVLKEVTRIIMESIRKDDLCGRYGGEEFMIILPKTDTTLAIETAERVRRNIENKKILGDKRSVTVSMGISTYPSHAKWKQELVEKSDQALYIAKENGKNRCVAWDNEVSYKGKGTNKLSGIVSGNVVQDSRNVLVIVDIMEQIKMESTRENKIFNLLGRIIEITEAQYGSIFVIKGNLIHEKYARKMFQENWIECPKYNKKILQSVIDKKQGVCMIDWDEITGYDAVTTMPNWDSVIVVPVINSGIVKGILYLTVSIKSKEFKFEDLNFVDTLGQLAVAVL